MTRAVSQNPINPQVADKPEDAIPASSPNKTSITAASVFATLKKGCETLKGLQIFAKIGRSMETLVNEIEKLRPVGISAGFKNVLKTFSTANGILSGLSSLVSLPERKARLEKMYGIAKNVFKGDFKELTFTYLTDEASFWIKQILGNDIELILFAEAHNLYSLGAASARLRIVKSFGDGISSTLSIIHKTIQIYNAKVKLVKSEATVVKWEGRAKDLNKWAREDLNSYCDKQILKTHLAFLDQSLKIAKTMKIDQKKLTAVEKQKAEVLETILKRKIVKISAKDATLSEKLQLLAKAPLSSEHRRQVSKLLTLMQYSDAERSAIDRLYAHYSSPKEIAKNKLAIIEKKIWESNIPLAARKELLECIKDKSKTPQAKIHSLLHLAGHGLYNPDNVWMDTFTKLAFLGKADAQDYHNLTLEQKDNQTRWKFLKKNNILAIDEVKSTLKAFTNAKIQEWRLTKDDQRKLITRSAISIAFSVGIIGLVTLGLILNFVAPGSLPPLVARHLPFAIAGLGIVVSIIGLIKFFGDELIKNPPQKKFGLPKTFEVLEEFADDEVTARLKKARYEYELNRHQNP